MDDDTLLNISIAVAFAGIIILLLLSFYDRIPSEDFNDIRCEDAGRYVKVEGTVDKIIRRNNSVTLRLEQRCFQDIFMFDDIDGISLNDTVTVQGTVQEYEGRLSILADKIIMKGESKGGSE